MPKPAVESCQTSDVSVLVCKSVGGRGIGIDTDENVADTDENVAVGVGLLLTMTLVEVTSISAQSPPTSVKRSCGLQPTSASFLSTYTGWDGCN